MELRVHGVSGTPPEALLGHPHVTQVAGDAFSRFFRPVGSDGQQVHAEDGHVIEGYHWGQFTSGSWRAGLWLILVPFGLINAAQFMLPGFTDRRSKILHTVVGALLRLLALLLTCLISFASAFVLIDLLAWRWAPKARMLKNFEASTVLTAAVALSALAVVVLFVLGRGFGVTGPRENVDMAQGVKTPLAKESFYLGDSDATTLRRLHLVAGLSLIAVMASFARHPYVADWTVLGILAGLLLLVTTLVVTFLGDPEGSVSVEMTSSMEGIRETWHRLLRPVSSGFVAVASLLVIGSALALRDVERPAEDIGRVETFDGVSNVLMFVGVITLVVMLVAAICLARATRSPNQDHSAPEHFFSRYAWGMAAYLVASVALFVGVGLSAAVATAVSTSLNLDLAETVDATGARTRTRVGATPMLDRVSYAWGLTMLLFLLVGVLGFVHYLRRRSHYVGIAGEMHAQPASATTELPLGWTRRIARSLWVARLKTKMPILFWVLAVFGAVLSLALAWEFIPCLSGEDPSKCQSAPGWFDLLSQPRRSGTGDFLTIFGAWTLLAMAAALVALGRGAVRTQSSRRGVNVIWDVISFWPHAVHPFVPRPYSQRTVLDLRNRIRWHLGRIKRTDVARPVVVCGHSQGSLIAFAAVMMLDQEERDRVGLVTFGSQLRLIFPRAFPAFVNLDAIARLYFSLNGAWVNLYRATDPLAGPVLSWDHTPDSAEPRSQHFPMPYEGRRPDSYDAATRRRISGADWRVIDPTPHDRELQTGPVTGLSGHGDFWNDPDWPRALRTVAAVSRPRRSGTECR